MLQFACQPESGNFLRLEGVSLPPKLSGGSGVKNIAFAQKKISCHRTELPIFTVIYVNMLVANRSYKNCDSGGHAKIAERFEEVVVDEYRMPMHCRLRLISRLKRTRPSSLSSRRKS
jgi:hypothetical protein